MRCIIAPLHALRTQLETIYLIISVRLARIKCSVMRLFNYLQLWKKFTSRKVYFQLRFLEVNFSGSKLFGDGSVYFEQIRPHWSVVSQITIYEQAYTSTRTLKYATRNRNQRIFSHYHSHTSRGFGV